MHQHGSDAHPQWEVHGIGLPKTSAHPVRGCQVAADSRAGKSTNMLLPLKVSELKLSSNFAYLITDPDYTILSEVCQNQATAQLAIVARHAKNHNLPTYQEGDVVKPFFPERFQKWSRKHFVICQVKFRPHCGLYELLHEFLYLIAIILYRSSSLFLKLFA
jgi:hypothetical protein